MRNTLEQPKPFKRWGCLGILAVHLASVSYAATIKSIQVEGAQRIDAETILSYCHHTSGENLSDAQMNKIMKDLFKTGLFADIKLRTEGQRLIVHVTENPMVNQVAFEGNNKISDDILKSEVNIRPRDIYTLARTQQAALRVVELYRARKGMFSASVTPKTIKLPENRVDVVFEIKEGPITRIRNIHFQGIKAFSASTLKNAIYSQESQWWRFFVSDDIFDQQRLNADKDALRRFYLNQGYADVQIKSAFAELATDHSSFSLTFVLHEGIRYRIQDVDFKTSRSDVPLESLRKELTLRKGQWYNAEKAEQLGHKLTEALTEQGLPFLDATPQVEKDPKTGTLKLVYSIEESQKSYVERVDIVNNARTIDCVIRREAQVSEGDAVNASKVAQTEKKIQDLGFFNSVQVTQEQGSAPDKSIVKIKVDERSTGELGLGVGGSNIDGMMMKVFFHEINFLGKGQELTLDAMMAKRRKDIDLSFTEPYFLSRPLVFGVDLSYTHTNRQRENNFNHHRLGGRVRLGYQLSEPLSHQVYYSLYRDEIKGIDTTKAAQAIIEQARRSVSSSVGHDFFYDKRDSKIDPTSGYYLSFGQDWAGVGGNVKYLRHRIGGGVFYPLTDKLISSFKVKAGTMKGLSGQKVRIIDRFFLGGPINLRGFEFEGIGPRDIKSKDALGGLNSYQLSCELSHPISAGKDFNLKGHVYLDGGAVWNAESPGSKAIHDEKALRASVGLGLSFRVPMLGDIGLFLSKPVRKKPYDQTQNFQFRIGRFF